MQAHLQALLQALLQARLQATLQAKKPLCQHAERGLAKNAPNLNSLQDQPLQALRRDCADKA